MAGILTAAAAAHAATPDPNSLVLRTSDVQALDLPVKVVLITAGYRSNAQAAREDHAPPVAQLRRWGRTNGYRVEFRPSLARRGEYGFTSGVEMFRSLKGTKEAMQHLLAVYGRESASGLRPTAIQGSIGDDAHGYTVSLTLENTTYEYIVIFWRYRTALGHLSISGRAKDVKLVDALRLARAQQAHMKDAFR